MIAGTTPDLLLAEIRLPPGFEPVDPRRPPDLEFEIVRVEIVDRAGNLRPWQWSDCPIPWEEALGWRVAPDGLAEPCSGCGRLTRRGYGEYGKSRNGRKKLKRWTAICADCDGGGYDE